MACIISYSCKIRICLLHKPIIWYRLVIFLQCIVSAYLYKMHLYKMYKLIFMMPISLAPHDQCPKKTPKNKCSSAKFALIY